MKDLATYRGLKICVALSGGRDSIALAHYIYLNKDGYGITLSAMNCDHGIRGESSARDSAFVKEWCASLNIPLICYKREGAEDGSENSARLWRLDCYRDALKKSGADVIATAHHLNDNAETVLFNLARGSSLSGLAGICDCEISGLKIIRPLINCSRREIDEYIKENNLPFTEDETNASERYTRNKIRLKVLPELEKAVPQAAEAIYRFSRLAAEDEQFFRKLVEERGLIESVPNGVKIKHCEQKPLFSRAAVSAVGRIFGRKDYTAWHAENLYFLQFSETGKRFEFLGLTARKEEGCVSIEENKEERFGEVPFYEYKGKDFCGVPLEITAEQKDGKVLKFDLDKIPKSAVIRFMKTGDRFQKFGGGTKSLGDYFTDKKIPVRLRKKIPLIADGNNVLLVCGVEISDGVKITEETQKIYYLICNAQTR
ncbi:MAG: tRNA lysidine(34) synthetase TilS [Clostridia bacterium]|nr:tRNA lysidine(34) synthetase TilS [Clostridia bacterium]